MTHEKTLSEKRAEAALKGGLAGGKIGGKAKKDPEKCAAAWRIGGRTTANKSTQAERSKRARVAAMARWKKCLGS